MPILRSSTFGCSVALSGISRLAPLSVAKRRAVLFCFDEKRRLEIAVEREPS